MFNGYQKNPANIYAVGLCNFIKKKLNRMNHSNRKKSHEVMNLKAAYLLFRIHFFKERKKIKAKQHRVGVGVLRNGSSFKIRSVTQTH